MQKRAERERQQAKDLEKRRREDAESLESREEEERPREEIAEKEGPVMIYNRKEQSEAK